MGVTIKQLEAFARVADLESFRRAARQLNTTQPNISARIASLESLLGTTLMERDAGSVRLTAQGRELLGYARRVLSAHDDLCMAAGDSALIDGVLRLGVTEMVAHTWLRAFLKALRECFPDLVVELSVDLSFHVERDLLQRTIDLALHNAPFTLETSGGVDLGSWPLIWVIAPDLLTGSDTGAPEAVLARHPVITHSRATPVYGEIVEHFSTPGRRSGRFVSSSNLTACLHMAVDGFGVAAVPEAMAADMIARGSLARVPYGWTPRPLHFHARYEAHRTPRFVHRAAELAGEVARGALSRG